jgi:tetratricopeptide (TPR) repeat protein
MSAPIHSTPGIHGEIRETLYQLSQRYHSHGLFDQTVRLLEFLLRHDPLRAAYHFALGKALHGQAQHALAIQSYGHAMTLGLPNIDVHLYLGQCLIHQGRFREADASLRQFITLARSPAETDTLAVLLQKARHLLEHVVSPRIQRAGAEPLGGSSLAVAPTPSSSVQSGMPPASAATTPPPRRQPLESSR